jgi:hypothetical protein
MVTAYFIRRRRSDAQTNRGKQDGVGLLGVITSHGPCRESYSPFASIKRLGGGIQWPAGRAHGLVCSKGASSAFIHGMHASVIAACAAGRRQIARVLRISRVAVRKVRSRPNSEISATR